MRRRTVQPEIRSFVSCFDPVSRHLTEAKRRTSTVSKSATFLATETVNSAPFKRGKTKVQIFGKKKSKTLREGANCWQGQFIANFSATKVTSLPSHSLSLSLSLCISLSLSHREKVRHSTRSASPLSNNSIERSSYKLAYKSDHH